MNNLFEPPATSKRLRQLIPARAPVPLLSNAWHYLWNDAGWDRETRHAACGALLNAERALLGESAFVEDPNADPADPDKPLEWIPPRSQPWPEYFETRAIR